MAKVVEKDRNGQSAKCGEGFAVWTTLGRGREASGSHRSNTRIDHQSATGTILHITYYYDI